MMPRTIWFQLAAAMAMGAPAATVADTPTTVSGKVFLDANANGRLDDGEKPIAGVKITEGVSIVMTGDDGSYTIHIKPDHMLKVPDTQVIALCWPTGKWPTTKHWRRWKTAAASPSAIATGTAPSRKRATPTAPPTTLPAF